MSEFSTISASSFDPSALAAKLTEKTADGWDVVAILPTGGDITAFLRRSTVEASEFTMVEEPVTAEHSTWNPVADAAPAPAAEPVAEPAGWGSAPDPVPAAPAPEPAPAYQPAVAAPVYTPAPAAAPAVPAGWYADPAGRFELRYWDGGTWTEHVSRAGQQFTDPPVA